jgi:MFS transporter, FSR family, fosmidomycin resistance protein
MLPPDSPVSASPPRTVLIVLVGLSVCHLLNDLLQSLLPALYPMLKDAYALDFSQIGLITLTNQVTSSILQPVVGLSTDRRPQPYSLAVGMGFTLVGLFMFATAKGYAGLLVAASLIGVGSSIFHPESSRFARLASGGGGTASRSRCSRLAGTSAGRLDRCWRRLSCCRAGRGVSPGSRS